MYLIILITGMIWIFFGSIFFAIRVSIKSLPKLLQNVPDGLTYMFFGCMVAGIIFIHSATQSKRRPSKKRLNKIFIDMLRYNSLRIPIAAFAMKSGLELSRVKVFLGLKIKKFNGKLTMDNNANIVYFDKSINKKKK
ncbi:MAG: hypothetical protein HW421_181 [Ignavibacteria bacterium]|nr:hypothetical protein [Ignavibacteria bacterium]